MAATTCSTKKLGRCHPLGIGYEIVDRKPFQNPICCKVLLSLASGGDHVGLVLTG